ncbi:RecX family transcriptional regulator [Sphingomonas montana]|uniref:RecX family transcriptional regulator n=1 Tax=Sphingomonas montana TaxID=1843236 RepID=UPI001F0AA7E7|nr:RecX family transcriptional regulator [Sphingomonas montana]
MARHSSNRNPDRVRPPLDREALERLALHYLGRYATTRAKLAAYLNRKLDERGWAEAGTGMDGAPGAPRPVDAIVAQMAELGYVDDRVFAEMRSAALGRRGYGRRRQVDALRAAGVGDEDRDAALAAADQDGGAGGGSFGVGFRDDHDDRDDHDREEEGRTSRDHAAALAFARRKRIGPFATGPTDPDVRRKALAAMMRAGHDYGLARRMIDCAPGEVPEI